jgi:response regulator NasT
MQKSLKILLAGTFNKHSHPFQAGLSEAGHSLLIAEKGVTNLLEQVNKFQPNLIILKLTSPEQTTLKTIKEVILQHRIPVILFSLKEDSRVVQQVIEAGVSTYIIDDPEEISGKRLLSIMDVAMARFREYQSLKDELIETKQQLQERKVIEQAKGILMQSRECNEEEAYQLLRRTAMERNQRMITVAEQLLSAHKLLQE